MVRQFVKYLAVGASSVILDIITLIALNKIGFRPYLCVVINQIFIISYNFILNRVWSFNSNRNFYKQAFRYAIAAILNYLFAILAMYLFNEQFGFDYRLVRLTTIAIASTWTFFAYKYWVYSK